MGAESSKDKTLLVEKRYKVDSPKTHRKEGFFREDLNISTYPDLRKEKLSEHQSQISCNPVPNDLPCSHPKKHFLCKRDRRLLEQSWRKTRKTGSDHIGSKIFLMILTSQPDIKAIFGMEKIPQGRLKYDPRFRQHAIVFTKTFDFVIKNIEYRDKLQAHFENLGRRHVAMQGRGFKPVYWETFAECMTQAAVEWEANRQRPTLVAWRTLISNIIMDMRRGFDEENNRRKVLNYRVRSPRQSYSHARGSLPTSERFY
ncbi:globin [Dictyocaulus viviparus]|uniref:Globin n=1 Tax=Dictyocaulus viviparus TaxID=29172 RepID=A0A0D8Y2E7_DICVI|nr:globin [Dictyocaulus viviparus]